MTHSSKHRKENNNYNNLRRKVVPFERDVSYYTRKGNQHFLRNNWSKALLYFKKTTEMAPEDPLNHYNLACLLSKMGQLEEANKVFEYIIGCMDKSYMDCYFLLAVNYGLMEEIEKAQSYLELYLSNAPDGELAIEAQELLWAITEDDLDDEYMEEYEDVLFKDSKEEIISDIREMSKDEFIRKHEKNSFFWNALKRILYQGNDALKEDIISIYEYIANQEAADTLKEFVRNPWVKDRLKQIALLKFKNMGYNEQCQAHLKGKVHEVNLKKFPLEAPFWEDRWQEVLNCTLSNMDKSNDYNDNFFEDVQAMWIDFINKSFPDIPVIKKCETWAAGLEYSLTRFHFLNVTQKEVADKYGVSVASVRSKFRVINETLNIDQKAYRNMLVYLFQADKNE